MTACPVCGEPETFWGFCLLCALMLAEIEAPSSVTKKPPGGSGGLPPLPPPPACRRAREDRRGC